MTTLALRSSKAITIAYIISPLAGPISLWVFMILYDIYKDQFAPLRELFVLPWLLMVGGVLALLVEFLIVTPLLMGFNRYRWRWLNGWTACALGFLASALPWLAVTALQILGANQTRTTWLEAFVQSAACGGVGLVGALVFRLIAVRAVESSGA